MFKDENGLKLAIGCSCVVWLVQVILALAFVAAGAWIIFKIAGVI